jgi:hypothetical protein
MAAWRWSRSGRHVDRPVIPEQGTWQYPELGALERHLWLAAYLLIPTMILVLAAIPGLHPGRIWYTLGGMLGDLAYVGLGGIIVSVALVSALVRVRLALLARRLDDRTALQ